jgi:hypothetical protein
LGTVLLLIDTRDQPPPEPSGRRWRASALRPALPLVEAGGLLVVSGWFPPFPAYILILGAVVIGGRGAARLIPMTNGLKDHRQ